ncbi:nad-dependent epimerase dehydratase [Leptolyngbya sp. Heron Island J]|uniref:NAD-dependent epimerase/dehydratase family protein n=1 Tax=Leptolyngbya sp. Heron Island J TaxID=1385935 RepID=UPI0003B939A4|nr:NAD-dependent epimerase/dehydratase family protein [Leptolyngbya sp. Heron Island J]ESA31953.1 nad-dependent epimerase dehydratase [Leptolyngbya sp. Heron Island J]
MKIFLTGATDYIGAVVAEKLQATGYSVLGLAATSDAAKRLQMLGIEPFLGSLQHPQQLTQAARHADGVIHTAFAYDFNNWKTSVRLDRRVIRHIIGVLTDSDRPFVATSDTAVLGDTGSAVADETYPVAKEATLAERATIEQEIQQAAQHQVRSIVLRLPVYIYGRESEATLTTIQIQTACEMQAVQYIDTGNQKFSATHVEDLADLYVLALEKAPAGSLFHTTTESGITARQVAEAIAHVTNSETESISFEEAVFNWGKTLATLLSINNQSSAQQAMEQLGWRPKPARSLLQDIQLGSYQALRFAPNDATQLRMLKILCDRTADFS